MIVPTIIITDDGIKSYLSGTIHVGDSANVNTTPELGGEGGAFCSTRALRNPYTHRCKK